MRRAICFVLLASGFLFSPFLIQRFTLGFHPAKLHPRLSFHAEWEEPVLTAEKEEEITAILNQTFTYFDLGSQSYVFASDDGKYVLKLFRYNRTQFPLIHAVKSWFHRKGPQILGKRRQRKSGFLEKIDKTFQACAMACRDVPECTQLLYIHLNLSQGRLPRITLFDPLGRKWELPLDQYRFAIQRKAEPFKATLTRVYESKNREEMERLLDSFIVILYERTGRCIRNSDPNYGPNFGFYRGKAVEIDCGNYRKCPELSEPERRIQEMHRFNRQLYVWLIKHAPEYSPYFHHRFTTAYEEIRAGRELS